MKCPQAQQSVLKFYVLHLKHLQEVFSQLKLKPEFRSIATSVLERFLTRPQ